MFVIYYLCRVGCGSFGEVYEGNWRNSVVAVKKIRIRTSGLSQEEKEEFQQEAAIMRYVVNLNIRTRVFLNTCCIMLELP